MAEMQSRWYAQVLAGAIGLPGAAQMAEDAARSSAERRRRHRLVHDRMPYLVDYSSYMDLLAQEIGCKPRWQELVRDPRLLHKVYTAPFGPVQYRLRGPDAEPRMARALLVASPSHWRGERYLDLALAALAERVGLAWMAPHLTLREVPRPIDRGDAAW
jgi:hypothetical protein